MERRPQSRPGPVGNTLLLMVCLAALASLASGLSRWKLSEREAAARLRELGAEIWTDSAGRIWKVNLARQPVGDDDLAILAELPHLQWLNLRGINTVKGELTDAGLRHLRGLKNLRVLNLSANSRLRDPGLAWLRGLTRLESLSLCGTRVTNDGLVYLKNMRRLRRLGLPGPTDRHGVLRYATAKSGGVTQEGLIHLHGSSIEEIGGIDLYEDGFPLLSGLNRLRRFPVSFPSPKDTDLIHLRNFTRLEVLDVSLSVDWTDSSRLGLLRNLTGLKTLEIGGRRVPDEHADWSGLRVLQHLPRLERLRLGGITDAGLAHLPRLERLRVLDLSCSPVTGSGLVYLDSLPRLEALALSRSSITDAGLADLREVPQLRELRLDGIPFHDGGFRHLTPQRFWDDRTGVQLTDDGLKHLAHTRQLRRLRLNGLPISDAGLHHLKHLSDLQSLELNGTDITDIALTHLRELRGLRDVRFWGTPVSYEAAARLHAALPQCRIADNWCCGCMRFEPLQRYARKD